ncbi:hypothetical protein J5Y03_07840 [Bacillus sp. RG28]|uniref:Uncharacterized protein n=2 Tax=Gottfriedia endophytica TaxID=2820819 RepID=A0A940SGI4_9BACI|nr:hypothetical protein [Gottfriedia endophytica]
MSTMLKDLPRGTKVSITNSIKSAFELYMKGLEWNLDEYSWEGFLQEWKQYNECNASWQANVDESLLNSEEFHTDLANKMSKDIQKMLNEDPSEEQVQQIESLIKELEVEDPTYSCKLEAKYHIDRLLSLVKA